MGIGAGLIVAIGAQNVFVLTRGIRKQYHWQIALLCSVCDTFLIFAGAAGIGRMVAGNHSLQVGAAWLGAIFLGWYGLRSLIAVAGNQSLTVDKREEASLRLLLLTALGLTFLNPHVYIDTILLLGSIGGQYQADGRYMFALGASCSSFLWFFTLSWFGALLAPLFKTSLAWKLLNVLICITMWTISYQLIIHQT